MNHGSLFSGIGGFELAAEWMGWDNKFHCEWNEFGQKVLKYYWPEAQSYHDIKETDFTIWKGKIDILTGGFPCQPYSNAGKRLGKEDDRHLWPEMLRAIQEIRPSWVVGENVLGITNWNDGLVFDEVQSDLEAEGYEVQPFVLPAAAVGAPHRRDRTWFIAHSHGAAEGYELRKGNGTKEEVRRSEKSHVSGALSGTRDATDANGLRQSGGEKSRDACQSWERNEKLLKGFCKPSSWREFPSQSPVFSRDDGLSNKLDGITFSKWRDESAKAYGNAIVPQVAYQIFKTIECYTTTNKNP